MKNGLFYRILITLSLAAALAAEAGIYKWQDEDGTWHFSETPPSQQAAEKIQIKTSPPASSKQVGAAESSADETGAEQPDDEPLPLAPEIAAAEKKLRAQNCKTAKENLQNLRHGEQIRYRDEKQGMVRYLSAEERDQWKEKARQAMAENCD